MNYSKILTGLFLGMFFLVNAQNDNVDQKLLAGGEEPGIIAKKLDQNTMVYSYSGKAKTNNIKSKKKSDNSKANSKEKNDAYQYPVMRASQGAILPFEIIFDGTAKSTAGIKAQENYFNNLMVKAEKNKIIYQDLETTRERLNNAGIFDAQDLNYFDMPLISKIVGAGVLITGKVTVDTIKADVSTDGTSAEGYNTKVIFTIYNKNGRPIYTKKEAPITATTIDSYNATFNHMLKQTPYYHKY